MSISAKLPNYCFVDESTNIFALQKFYLSLAILNNSTDIEIYDNKFLISYDFEVIKCFIDSKYFDRIPGDPG
jgi:hypothetical protein